MDTLATRAFHKLLKSGKVYVGADGYLLEEGNSEYSCRVNEAGQQVYKCFEYADGSIIEVEFFEKGALEGKAKYIRVRQSRSAESESFVFTLYGTNKKIHHVFLLDY